MNKVTTANGYDYYVGMEDGKPFYNIVPTGHPAPDGGYAREYICGIKKVPDMFDQPKKVGLTKSQLMFFKTPRTMKDIMDILFKGDAWEANEFQNNQINAGNLETCLIDNPAGKDYGKIIAIKKK